MITFLVLGENTSNNEKIASSIIGGTEHDTCAICMSSQKEALKLVNSRKYPIDLFVVTIKMKEQGGYRFAEKIRKIREYKNTPILFVTNLTYNLVGFETLTSYESYKKYNYISLPISRLDVQGKFGLYVENIIKKQCEKSKSERAIYLKHNKGEVFVDVKDIVFAEVQNKICKVHTETNEYQIDRCSLQQIINIVDDDYFVRCHKSFAININKVKGFSKNDKRMWQAIFEKDSVCLISKTYIETVLNMYKSTIQDK